MAEDPNRWSTPAGAVALSPVPPLDEPPGRPWGPWASVGWTALAVALMLATQFLTLVITAFARLLANPKLDPSSLGPNGKLVAVGTLISAPLVLGLITLLVRVRGWRVRDYLGLRTASRRSTVLSISFLILGLAASDGLTLALGRPIVPPLMVDTIFTAPLWLVSLTVALAAPMIEEILFRGFLYRGLAESPRLGPGMAIGITALTWAALHAAQYELSATPYDLYGLATIYLIGLYLGLVRYWTGSNLLTIILHALANTIATAEAVYFAG